MTIDLPDRLTALDVARQQGVGLKTVRRWMRAGVVGPGGTRVKLPCRRVGGRWVTCGAWVGQFLAALNPPDADTPHTVRSPAEERKAGRDDLKRLKALLGGRK